MAKWKRGISSNLDALSGEGVIYLIIGLVVLFASFVQGISGFGQALVSMAILPFILPLRIVTPLVLLNGLAVTTMVFITKRKHFEMRGIITLLVSAALGIPFGIFILTYSNESILRKLLAALIALFSVYSLMGLLPAKPISSRWAYLFGFLAGSLGAAFNINGPPVIVYAALQKWEKDRMIANLQAFFLSSAFLIGTGHALRGLYTADVLFMWVMLIPVIFIGTYAGNLINSRIDTERFTRIVFTLLIIVALMMLTA